MRIRIGCAGWAIPRGQAQGFPGHGSHLERYAAIFSAVEINSSFHRPHRRETYERWASSVPGEFRFAVKVPRQITHVGRLQELDPLAAFLHQVGGLGTKLGPLLVQLPPSLGFDSSTARRFLAALRDRFAGGVALEPRHPSWLSPAAERLLRELVVARVAADPPMSQAAAEPGGWEGLRYYRLHGSPRIYRSSYPEGRLDALAERLLSASSTSEELWCIFDNTAQGAATVNALYLSKRLKG
jgi:uncharacterized protein YecE (DUF72 family)